ncbi:hypothetical protein [Legionella israelensis]|uniref:Uncharacterized protein n=1 Tax=Legionella israelensis TaxID=454 RepID=A0A0W0V823_9GAMM|nr:hypothetical protein [Legionella israelensis]KTD16022.1 hypothetical protein Lisr_2169 [Legionella israelensis]QBS08822.1 hypothetical protein E4T55_02470 [Legionella israelensis]QDP73086.1 hypothetical protein FOG18_11185 [Legionella israelensis]SCY05505.1 hypothetical protein SAMN02746069_01131 [Legionella israelensis DSM 19235]STX58504.1 Uncharacterised protein [Legionella israelensis]
MIGFKGLTALALGITSSIAIASPNYLITHNKTNLESNAYVANSIPSRHPTPAHSDGKVSWTLVKIACFGRSTNGVCPAMIKMATNTPQPFDLGMVYLNLSTGDISPKVLSAHGYKMTVNGPGEATLTQN